MTEAIDERIVQDRLVAQLSIAFGVVAALLAAMGLYGVLSYGVARRTSEIGIRKALGAQQGALMAMIMRETGWLLLAGLVAGGALSVATMQSHRQPALRPVAGRSGDVRRRHRPRWRSSHSSRRGCRRIARRASIRSSRCGNE